MYLFSNYFLANLSTFSDRINNIYQHLINEYVCMDSILTTDSTSAKENTKPVSAKNVTTEAFAELCMEVHAALETYSNVHRGSGHNSIVSTYLFEQAREIVLEYLGLEKDKFVVIFCSPRSAEVLKTQLKPGSYKIVSSQDIGIPLGVRAIAAGRKALPGGAPFHTGGGTTRLVSPDWVDLG